MNNDAPKLPNPFYQDSAVTLYHGDAMELAPRLGVFADAVITDPPYGETSLDWDVWPKGWPAVAGKLAPSLWCFGSFRMFWEQRDQFEGWNLAQEIVWEKHNGSGLHADRFRRVHELATQFYQGQWEDVYKRPPEIEIVENRKRGLLTRGQKPEHFGAVESGSGYTYDGTRLMRSVIPVRSCHGHAVNETQKPEGIVRPLVLYSVPVGGLVIDLFAGSGTTLAVSRQHGRRAIGIEKRESQCEEIVKRLAQQTMQFEAQETA